MSHCRFLIVLALGISILAMGCAESPDDGAAADSKKVLRRGNGGEPGTLDPGLASDIHAFNILIDLYEGLLAEGADGSLIPGVAESWQVSSDGLLYTFTLRDDARWSDGSQVVASDFVDSLRRAAAPEAMSPYSFVLQPLAEVSAESDTTLVMTLSKPTSHWLSVLALPIAFPVKQASDGAQLTNGPYRLLERQAGGLVRLVRNEQFWAADTVAIDEVEYHPIVNPVAEFNQYRAGELDITHNIPSSNVDALRVDYQGEVRIAPSLALYYLAFDLTESPLDNRSLRAALSMAIDREALVAVIGRGERAAYGVVPPGVAGHDNARYDWKDLSDPEREQAAREYFALAGYGPDNLLQLQLTYDVGDIHERVALAVASMWRDVLGIETSLEKMEWKLFLNTREHRTAWQVMRFAWFGDYNSPMTFLEIFETGSPQNLAQYENDRFDELLSTAGGEANMDSGRRLTHAAEQALIDDYPIAPLYFFVSKHLVRPGISGFEDNVLDRHPSRFLDISNQER